MKKFPSKIAILGVGLIGGSIAMGLKKHFGADVTILGSCKSVKRAQIAKQLGLIDEVINLRSRPLGLLLMKVNIVILATPVRETVKLIKLLSREKFRNCLIIDTGSTKKLVLDTAKQFLKSQISFIGTHPMAGSEMSGFENALVNLFRNKPWIVCSDQLPTDNKQLAIVAQIIEILGAKIVLMDAKKHDELISWASHLALITASILVNAVAGHKNWQQIAEIASTGFRDTTRLASDNPQMKTDIVVTNKSQLLESIGKFKNELDIFSNLVRQSGEESIFKYFQDSKNIRDKWVTNYFN